MGMTQYICLVDDKHTIDQTRIPKIHLWRIDWPISLKNYLKRLYWNINLITYMYIVQY